MVAAFLVACLMGQAEPTVVVFLGVECPLSRLYASRLNDWHDKYPGVTFRAVDANDHDSADDVAAFAEEFRFSVPFTKDGTLARRLGATRNPEAFILVGERIVYRGRIDDRYTPGQPHRAEPKRFDLELALQEVLAGKPVSVPQTKPVGCFIDLADEPAAGGPTYPDVAGILHRRCAECHHPGAVAPFSLLTYEDAAGWAATIREVVAEERMPPWKAEGGPFANDMSLTAAEKNLLYAWIDTGAPQGDPSLMPEPPTFTDGWQTSPDVVLQMVEPFEVPAEGVIEYQEFVVGGFDRDTFVQAVEIRPGNPSVVHHINVYQRPKGSPPGTLAVSKDGDYFLGVFLPGHAVTSFAPGIAKLVPAGWEIVFEVHYVANGTPHRDCSSIGLKLAEDAKYLASSRLLLREDYVIPPNCVRTFTAEQTLESDFMLAAMFPHMHLRGKSMRFEVIYPDGRQETLLNVPKYDFGWQHRYVMAEPKLLPKGTVLRCTAVFDNTADNPNNPDPNATVRHGRRTTDEMFEAVFDVYRPIGLTVNYRLLTLLAVCLLASFVWLQRG